MRGLPFRATQADIADVRLGLLYNKLCVICVVFLLFILFI
jgi:hypothetical protein